jgi:hypothetical protein
MQAIKAYYKICNIMPENKQAKPMINLIKEDILDIIFTEKEIKLYTKKKNNNIYMIDNIIGAKETTKYNKYFLFL